MITLNDATWRFIRDHRTDDVRRLALMGVKTSEIDLPLALQQIQGWQTARTKLPSWAAKEEIVYPPHLNMEQCSSETTAEYKRDLVKRLCMVRKTMADLTGGMGIDFSTLAQDFDSSFLRQGGLWGPHPDALCADGTQWSRAGPGPCGDTQ